MQIQKTLSSDIVMVFDECSPYPCERVRLEKALERTHRWAKRCREYELQAHQNLFGIVQGGVHPDLRKQSAEELATLNFEGYAIGGLSVGEPAQVMNEIIEATEPYLPKDKPRYLMGVGFPRDIIAAVREKRPPAVTGEDGRRVVAIIQGVYESGRTGRPVKL